MFQLQCTSLRFDAATLDFHVLDQRALPLREEYLALRNPDDVIHAIRQLAVRGAPLIGVVAALGLAQWTAAHAAEGLSWASIEIQVERMRIARPTAVNLAVCVDRWARALRKGFVEGNPSAESLRHLALEEARMLFDEDVELCRLMGRAGATLFKDRERVLTICNTGALATVGEGTAFAVLREAHRLGKLEHVYVCETRPLLQGARLTSWELGRAGIPYSILTDGMAAYLMSKKSVTRVMTGADRIALNGDFANKVGSYSLAVSARYHGIPFHPVAPSTTLDAKCATGAQIPIEERSVDEVLGCVIPQAQVRWAPIDAQAWNPSFDVTPRSLVTSLVLDDRIFSSDELAAGALSKFAQKKWG